MKCQSYNLYPFGYGELPEVIPGLRKVATCYDKLGAYNLNVRKLNDYNKQA